MRLFETTRHFLVLTTIALALAAGCTTGSSTGEPEPSPEGEPEGCVQDGIELGDTPADDPISPAGGAPDLSCLTTPVTVSGTTDVTVEGCVDIFGLGSKAENDLEVSVFGDDQDPSTDTPRYGVHEIETDTEGGDLAELAQDCDAKGYYRATNIPTHTPLIFKVYDPVVDVNRVALDTYTYNIVFFDEDIVDDTIIYEANLIYNSTIETIVPLAGRPIEGSSDINDGVGRASIAGEIHDCADLLIQNVVVGSDKADNETATVYFDGREDPKPSPIRQSTNTDALYAILNVVTAAGNNTHTVTTGIKDTECEGEECQCITLGTATVQTFADSVTILTFRGPPPVIE